MLLLSKNLVEQHRKVRRLTNNGPCSMMQGIIASEQERLAQKRKAIELKSSWLKREKREIGWFRRG
jgi:hypothetical protein